MDTYDITIPKPTILLIDSAHALRRNIYQPNLRELSNSIGTPTGGIYGYFNSLRAAVSNFSAQSIIICHEGGHSERRKEIYSDYKKRDTSKEEVRDIHGFTDYEYYKHQLSWIQTILDNLGIPQLRVEGKEGDDILFQVSRLLDGNKIIISEDSDFFSLVSEDISVYRPIKKVYVCLENFEEVTGLPSPRHYLYSKVLSGDGSDNIPCICKGVGYKTIQDILCKIKDPLEITPSRILEEASFFKTSRYRKVVDAGLAPIIRNLDLIDISREVFNVFELQYLADSITKQYYPNEIRVRKLFKNLEFNESTVNSFINKMSRMSSYSLSPFIKRDYIKNVMLGITSAVQG